MMAARMRTVIALALALASTPVVALQRTVAVCTEEVALKLLEIGRPSEAAPQKIAPAKFSVVLDRDLLSVISAGRTDYYECQEARARLNEGTPRGAIKCQNGIYFLVIDLRELRFVKAQLNPQEPGNVGLSYGSCQNF